jgi:hypothetical protein
MAGIGFDLKKIYKEKVWQEIFGERCTAPGYSRPTITLWAQFYYVLVLEYIM